MQPSEAQAALELRGVTSGYGETVVLEGLDFRLGPGESVSVLGRNGVGKTTLLATMMGHATLHHGMVLLHGHEVGRLPIFRRNHMGLGYVPQERLVFPSLTVEENLAVAARPGPWTLEEAYKLFPRLHERRGHYGNELSGGEQQMLATARALVGNPSVLLLDEPSEGLAPQIVQELLRVFGQLRREGRMAMILVEQKASVALAFAERALVMDRGGVVYDGSSGALRDDPDRLHRLIGVGG